MKQNQKSFSLPTVEQLEAELKRETSRVWRRRKTGTRQKRAYSESSCERLAEGKSGEIEGESGKRDGGECAREAFTTPVVAQLEAELKRTKYKKQYWRMLRSTVSCLLVVAAIVVLISNMLPILRIYGASMTPTLVNGNIVATARKDSYGRGDVIAFYYNNKILVKRVIGLPGEWIDIDESGNVSISGELLDEPYLDEKSFGECDIELPYQVPDGRYFVMGDHRSVSSDSRSSQVGCVTEEQIVGKLLIRLWPLGEIGTIE